MIQYHNSCAKKKKKKKWPSSCQTVPLAWVYVKASHSSNLFCTKKSQYLISCDQVGPFLRPASDIYCMFCPSLCLPGYVVCIKHRQKTAALRRSGFRSLRFPPTAPCVTPVQNRLFLHCKYELQPSGWQVQTLEEEQRIASLYPRRIAFEKSHQDCYQYMNKNENKQQLQDLNDALQLCAHLHSLLKEEEKWGRRSSFRSKSAGSLVEF